MFTSCAICIQRPITIVATRSTTSSHLRHAAVAYSPSRRLSSSSSTPPTPRKSGGGTALLVSAVLCCGAVIAYVHVSQRTAQEKMHRAVVLDKEKLRARRAAQRAATANQAATATAASTADTASEAASS